MLPARADEDDEDELLVDCVVVDGPYLPPGLNGPLPGLRAAPTPAAAASASKTVSFVPLTASKLLLMATSASTAKQLSRNENAGPSSGKLSKASSRITKSSFAAVKTTCLTSFCLTMISSASPPIITATELPETTAARSPSSAPRAAFSNSFFLSLSLYSS